LSPTPAYLAVGRIGRAHGVHGEVCVDVLTDFPERFDPGTILYIGPEAAVAPTPATVESARPHKNRLLVRFDAATDRTAAERLTGLFVFIPGAEARVLDPEGYYAYQLIGLEVVTDQGRALGSVAGLLETGSADVLHVHGRDGDVLIPMIADVVRSVDLAAGRVTIIPLPGLLD